MKRFFCFLIFAVSVFVLVSGSFAQTTNKVDLGKLRGNSYTNEFFEFKIEFPFGWLVGDNALESQLTAIQKGSVQAKNTKNQKALNDAMNRVTPLLGGYKLLPGSSSENSNLRVMAERLPATARIKTSEEYLNQMIRTLRLAKLPSDYFISVIKTDFIEGKLIYYVDTKYSGVQSRMYVIVKKGFAVLFSITAYNDSEFEALINVFQAANLNYKKQN